MVRKMTEKIIIVQLKFDSREFAIGSNNNNKNFINNLEHERDILIICNSAVIMN